MIDDMIPSTMAEYALRARAAGARIIGKTSYKNTRLITPLIRGKNIIEVTEVNWKLLMIDDEMKRVIGYLDSPWFRQGHRNQYKGASNLLIMFEQINPFQRVGIS